jgi:hypothetical protein
VLDDVKENIQKPSQKIKVAINLDKTKFQAKKTTKIFTK